MSTHGRPSERAGIINFSAISQFASPVSREIFRGIKNFFHFQNFLLSFSYFPVFQILPKTILFNIHNTPISKSHTFYLSMKIQFSFYSFFCPSFIIFHASISPFSLTSLHIIPVALFEIRCPEDKPGLERRKDSLSNMIYKSYLHTLARLSAALFF